jgi:hypothetical protein
MLHSLLKLALFLTVLFAAAVSLIHAQPYDDSGLRALLTPPDGCPAPCFMGIQPGLTRTDEAIHLLEAHEWVESVEQPNPLTLLWTWSGSQPALIDTLLPGQALVSTREDVIARLSLRTTIPTGQLEVLWGRPHGYEATFALRGGVTPAGIFHRLEYSQQQTILETRTPLCAPFGTFHQSKARLEIGQYYDNIYVLDFLAFRERVRYLNIMACG